MSNHKIENKKDLTLFLKEEIARHGKTSRIGSWLGFSERAILIRHQVLLRKTEYYVNTGKKLPALLCRIRLNRLQNRYGLHIPINSCEKGLKIMHLGPVLVNSNSHLGQNCSLHMNVCIVAGGLTNEAPVLGDGVVVGVGAAIVGNVHIANNVAIGANAVVTHDVSEENIAVAGVPARKVSEHGRLTWNRSNKDG